MNKTKVLVSALTFVAASHLASARPELPALVELNIESQPLDHAISRWSEQTGYQVLFPAEPNAERHIAPIVKGDYTAENALKLLLASTDLKYEFINARTVAIHEPSASRVRLADAGSQAAGSTSSAAADEGGKGLTEVIVTATRRSERLQDVPASIAVISNQDIERRGLIGMEDYLRSIPGVNQIDNGPRSNAIVIRGITTQPTGENVNGTTVATYFGETPITAAGGRGAGGIDIRPVDIERIELLRGPQGTDFGSSSLGGTLRIIPAKPKLDAFDARVSTAYSNTSGPGSSNNMIQGMLNAPLVDDVFGIRAVAYRFDESGFYRNIAGTDPATLARANAAGLGNYVAGFVQNDVGRTISTGGRIAALFKPTEQLNLSLDYLHQKIEQNGYPGGVVGKYDQVTIPIAPQSRVDGEMGASSQTLVDLASLTLNYDLGWATLTTVGSWIQGSSAWTADQSTLFPFFNTTTVPSDFRSWTGEARLVSQTPGRIHYIAGLYYEKIGDGSVQSLYWPGTPATNPFGATGTDPLAIVAVNRDLKQRAVFGELAYDLTDTVTATIGGRYFKYDKAEHNLREGALLGRPLGTGVTTDTGADENNNSLKAKLAYKPTRDALIYASWTEGFRLGLTQAGLLPGVCDTNNDGIVDGSNGLTIESTRKVDSDTLKNYELGGKFSMFGRMTVDAAAYHIKWNGLPARNNVTCGASLQSYTANLGSATSNGVELQASVVVVDGLRVDFGGGYTKARLSSTTSLGADGSRLPGSPNASANLAAQYEFELSGRPTFVRLDSFYTGKFYSTVQQTGLEAGGYYKVDARAGMAWGKLTTELFVNNLTNEDAVTWPASTVSGFRLRPRTVGVQLGYSFR